MNEDIERMYIDNSDAVYRFIYLLIRHKETAEDLTQETFYKAVKSMNKFNYRSSVLTWLLKIARNVTYDHLRRKKVIQFLSLGTKNECDIEKQSPVEIAEKKEDLLRLYNALERIKKDYRDVLILRKVNERSIKETSYILGWTEAKVKAKMARGLEALRKEYDGKEGFIDGSIKGN
ncbi:RNA polymerase sigma factor [Bacillus sp. 1P06AnD]|uniref:RNA polymerase sigma factor n=1 Tax=Bacillus sp. 1P06AnD TaxID=3132208 RepID=UPI0039A31A68